MSLFGGKKCDESILKSYGLKGYKTSEKMPLGMCPNIKKSCCREEDQMAIYQNWVVGKEKFRVEQHYEVVFKAYKTLMTIFKTTTQDAKKLLEIQKNKKQGNCKFLADLIVGYEIEKQTKDLEKSIKKLQEFFLNSYQGVYCTMCDGDLQKYLSSQKGKVVLSDLFCRNMMIDTLTPLLFFHQHFPKLANIVSMYLTSCTFKGDYIRDSLVPQKVVFKKLLKKEILLNKKLDLCRSYRNNINWFIYCQDICKEFKVGEFSPFFDGDMKTVENFIKFAQRRLKQLANDAKKEPLLSGMRVLTEKGGDNKSGDKGGDKKDGEKKDGEKKDGEKKDGEKKDGEKDGDDEKDKEKKKDSKPKKEVKKNIFNSMGGGGNLQKFKTEFREKGIDLNEIGKTSVIVKGMFDMVKEKVNKEKMKKGGRKLIDTSGDSSGRKKERNLAGASDIVKQILLAFLLIMI
jgi:hypothetical protein